MTVAAGQPLPDRNGTRGIAFRLQERMEQPTTRAEEAAAVAATSTMALEEPASPPPSDQSSLTEEPGIILANPAPTSTMGQSGEDVCRKDEASSPPGEASGPREMAREERKSY